MIAINEYCEKIGQDPLLVQGAGGNVSWKDKDVLWVKASGTWLADANKKNIFVPVNLPLLQEAFKRQDFTIEPTVLESAPLKPSIETLLHALMVDPIVMHLHAVEMLAFLVRQDCYSLLADRMPKKIKWVFVNYHKPGAPLAEAIFHALQNEPNATVIFLKNHGVVIAGNDVESIHETLQALRTALHSDLMMVKPVLAYAESHSADYLPFPDSDVHALACNTVLLKRLSNDWALYPDHIVFLGEKAYVYADWESFASDPNTPDLIFIAHQGVYIKESFSQAKRTQLRCYYDVLIRNADYPLSTLDAHSIGELLNWDAEHYRIHMEK